MSKKTYDTSSVENELRGASSFFKPHTPVPAETPAAPKPPREPKSEAETVNAPEVRRRDVTMSNSHDVKPASPAPPKLDINQETASHDTLRLAVPETKEIEALKSALKWDHDLSVSKNDICRVALHALFEDFMANGSQSEAVKRLTKKSGR